ncbi:MAG: HDOD domain-containing protein [Patescibacteria group bacterium]|nr:HDOD domain-containing protein [Patescibacteria group bacterium]
MSQATISSSRPKLETVAQRIHFMSSLPHVALRVMEVVQDPRSGARELKEAMETDPALCVRVLRCVNSSAYALRSPISSLQHAIAYLGSAQIRNLAMTAAVSELFKQPCSVGAYERVALWKHLVAVGIAARMIAMRTCMANFEDMFLAGLLHDIGIVLEDQYIHPQFCDVMTALRPGVSLTAVEHDVLGFDHTTLAHRMARDWKFPEVVAVAARHHHDSTQYMGEHLDVVRCVEAANVICALKGITSVGVNTVQFSADIFEALSLTKEDVVVLAGHLDKEIEANQSIFQV